MLKTEKYQVGTRWQFINNGRLYGVVWVTPEVTALPATDRILYLQQVGGDREIMPMPLALADLLLRVPATVSPAEAGPLPPDATQ